MTSSRKKGLLLSPDRVFSPEPGLRRRARELYASVKDLPLLCPHGHVDPRLFSDPQARFGNPVQLLVQADHYVLRMLYSRGIPMEKLGLGKKGEKRPEKIWRVFAENFHLFLGTPSGYWLKDQLENVFGIREALSPRSGERIFDKLSDKLKSPAFAPRALFERFGIEVLASTDAATDDLAAHRALARSGWKGRVIPTFRPDGVLDPAQPDFAKNIRKLSELTGEDTQEYKGFLRGLEKRRQDFKALGATATDHGARSPLTVKLGLAEAAKLFQRALKGRLFPGEADLFVGHMMVEMARMSVEDGLVMQFHPGSFRNHNPFVFEAFGPDKGADIPVAAEFTRNLKPLLDRFGNDGRLTLVLFTLDESCYSRELAPLAGHYPSLVLGPPWWFHDSFQGMRRFRESAMETAGLQNTAGFNDDARNFCSIPSRHDLARRLDADWLAGLWARGFLDREEAKSMARDCAYNLAKRTYKL